MYMHACMEQSSGRDVKLTYLSVIDDDRLLFGVAGRPDEYCFVC